MWRTSTVLLTVLFGVTAVAQAQQLSDPEFLKLAAQRVHEYVTAFHDLTAEETTTVWYYDSSHAVQRDTIVSDLIIYRSQADPSISVEYRDVVSVNGKKIQNHGDRARKLLGKRMESDSVAEELARISEEGNRFNQRASVVNSTLLQAIPLWPECVSAFRFVFEGSEEIRGIPSRVYAYEQLKPCGTFAYTFDLTTDFQIAPLTHAGRLWLESSTARVVREDRTVYVQDKRAGPDSRIAFLQAHFDYRSSNFGILVPASIWYESYTFRHSVIGEKPYPRPRVLLDQTYGPFLRFSVSVEETVIPSEPK